MKYVEMTIEEAMKRCNKNKKVLVAVQDLEDENIDIIFLKKEKSEYREIFEDVKQLLMNKQIYFTSFIIFSFSIK